MSLTQIKVVELSRILCSSRLLNLTSNYAGRWLTLLSDAGCSFLM